MALKCPNKSHPDWKALVAKHGERKAIQMYVQNDYNIPNVDGSKKSMRRKVQVDSTYDFRGRVFPKKTTLDSMEKHPELASQIIDELRRLFPEIRVFKDRILDENGNYLEIPPGKQGRHYRSAFMSAVAWSASSSLETPPHEYAHEYIDMYRNHPLVKQGIEKYGEERLVTLIARKYTGQKMSGSFNNWLQSFWSLIRNTFGFPSVVDVLTDSFAKNEKLGPSYYRSQGNAVHNYQDAVAPNYKQETIMDYNEDIERNKGKIKVEKLSKTLQDMKTVFVGYQDVETSDKQRQTTVGRFNETANMVTHLSSDEMGNAYNYAGVDKKLVEKARQTLNIEENAVKIFNYIKGGEVDLTIEQREALDTFMKLERVRKHKKLINESIVEKDGSYVSKETVNEIATEEVGTNILKRRKLLESKNKFAKMLGKSINKGLRYVTNTRLWAKYLSGGENTIVSKIAYKQLNDAKEQFAEFRQGMEDIMGAKSEWVSKGSAFDNPKATIEELDGKEIGGVKLTNAEMLSIYLMNRQEDKKGDLRKGFYLEQIEGRILPLDSKYQLTEAEIQSVVNEIENNQDVMDYVAKIDQVYKYTYDKVNSQFKLLEGYDLDKYENYFPVSHGKQTTDVSKKKNLISDFKALHMRVENASEVRLVDPQKVLATTKMTNASYYAYAIPVHNAQQVMNHLSSKFTKGVDDTQYIEAIKGSINKIQDSGTLYSTDAESKFAKTMNKLQGNFAVALLAKNLGVVFKQQVSLVTAENEIDGKYIRRSGASLGPINFVNPIKLLKALSFTGFKDGKTWMPIEWQQLENNPEYQELIKNPIFRERFSGVVSKEAGEAIMGKEIADDKIKVPFIKKDGKPVYVTKGRLMQGITIMDTLTIIRIYNAVKLETQDKMQLSEFANMTEEQIMQHNIRRTLEITDKTQPTFDQLNRTGLSQNNDPLSRALTMFSSATQKIGMGLTESLIDYINDPTSENKKRAIKRYVHAGITTSMMITTIDVLRHGLLSGFDDDDELWEAYASNAIVGTVGSIQGVGTMLGVIISQLDSNPWYKTVQHPVETIMQEGSEAVSNVLKGNWSSALKQSIGTYSKVKGFPFTIYSNTSKVVKRFTE